MPPKKKKIIKSLKQEKNLEEKSEEDELKKLGINSTMLLRKQLLSLHR